MKFILENSEKNHSLSRAVEKVNMKLENLYFNASFLIFIKIYQINCSLFSEGGGGSLFDTRLRYGSDPLATPKTQLMSKFFSISILYVDVLFDGVNFLPPPPPESFPLNP